MAKRILGTIYYYLQPLWLPHMKGKYKARPSELINHDVDSFVEGMEDIGLSKNVIKTVLSAVEQHAEKLTASGQCFNLGFIRSNINIAGVFDGLDDSFDPARHHSSISIQPGKKLMDAAQQLEVQKVDAPPPHSGMISAVQNLRPGTEPLSFAAGDPIELRGQDIKVEGDSPDVGLYLEAGDGSLSPCPIVVDNSPSRQAYLVPAVPAGTK